MFEFEQYDGELVASWKHPALNAKTQSEMGRNRIRSYSLMNWGEHCTECVFPSCYKTCSFYQARPDGRCRRFTFGIYPAPSPRSWMGYSALVEFKNWSKLWAQGNATQLPNSFTVILQLAGSIAWSLNAPVDWLLRKLTGRKRLSLVLQSLRRRIIRRIGRLYRSFAKPDCFLFEVFNPMTISAQLHLWACKAKADQAARFEWTSQAPPGFSSFAIPISDMERWVDLSQELEMGISIDEEAGKTLYICSATFVRLASHPAPPILAAKASGQRKIKCVVWDLDNTLWDGILVEAESTPPKLKDGIRSVLQELDRRGILLSIASKNAEEDARKILEALGIWEFFLAPQINWQPKSASIKRIAEKLNLGLDAFAFVDDLPFERDEVSGTLPMVTVVPAEECQELLGRAEFRGDASSEGAPRRLMYQTEIIREQAMAESRLSYDAFLTTCGIRIKIERPNDTLLPRINDIVQRTNQLNIASQRYEIDEILALIQRKECDCYIVSCSDKYGNYGYVGFIVVTFQENGILIRDCMFSCRIQGKRIDEAVLARLINHYLHGGCSAVKARFIPTKRNAPAREMLARLGFTTQCGVEGVLCIEPPSPRPEVEYVQIESDFR